MGDLCTDAFDGSLAFLQRVISIQRSFIIAAMSGYRTDEYQRHI